MVEDREIPIVDHYKTKECAIKLAVDAAVTVLRVDQIIMARPAGGPKPRKKIIKFRDGLPVIDSV